MFLLMFKTERPEGLTDLDFVGAFQSEEAAVKHVDGGFGAFVDAEWQRRMLESDHTDIVRAKSIKATPPQEHAERLAYEDSVIDVTVKCNYVLVEY